MTRICDNDLCFKYFVFRFLLFFIDNNILASLTYGFLIPAQEYSQRGNYNMIIFCCTGNIVSCGVSKPKCNIVMYMFHLYLFYTAFLVRMLALG